MSLFCQFSWPPLLETKFEYLSLCFVKLFSGISWFFSNRKKKRSWVKSHPVLVKYFYATLRSAKKWNDGSRATLIRETLPDVLPHHVNQRIVYATNRQLTPVSVLNAKSESEDYFSNSFLSFLAPSRNLDHPRPWEEEDPFDRSVSCRGSSVGRSTGAISSYNGKYQLLSVTVCL